MNAELVVTAFDRVKNVRFDGALPRRKKQVNQSWMYYIDRSVAISRMGIA